MLSHADTIIYEFESFRLDEGKRLLLNGGEGPLPLTPKAFDTLLYLVKNSGRTIEKDELMSAVWGDTIVEENSLNKNISVLRRTLGEDPRQHRFIVTVPGTGYKFVASIVESSANGIKGAYIAPAESTLLNSSEPRKERSPSKRFVFAAAGVIVVIAIAVGSAALILNRSNNANNTSAAIADLSLTRLTNGEDIHGPAISRDGKVFAFNTFDGERYRLFLQSTGQLNAIEIFQSTTISCHSKTFSPDGGYIYFSARDKDESEISLYRISVFGGSPKKILTGININSAVSFSPDGNEFVFSRRKNDTGETAIVIARTDGSNERELLSSQSDQLEYPAWSPDGKQIAFVRLGLAEWPKDRPVYIESISPDGGPSGRLIQERLDNCYRIAWTSGSDGLVFGGTKFGEAMTGRRDQVWFVSLSSQRITRLSPEGVRYIFGGLTDDNAVIIGSVSRTSQIWSIDSGGDSRTAIQLTTGSTDGRTGIAPLPDGRVGYMTRNGDNWELWMMNGDGSGTSQVYSDKPDMDELRATADGRYFIFNSNVNRSAQLFRLNTDGSGLKQLTFDEEGHIGDSTPSSDSQSVVYTRNVIKNASTDSSFLYRIPIDGGEPVPIEGVRAPSTPHYSPDGKYLSYIDWSTQRPRLTVLFTDGKPRDRFFEAVDTNLLNVGAVWTPDGKSLANIVYQNKASNIWLQPIDGAPPYQLTDFTSGHIHRMAYSIDGKRIYLARGYTVNDALLVKGFIE
jgi:DNA-binding winged helix-turn-helix (wHTH) protein/Tol biopolymer transport system component